MPLDARRRRAVAALEDPSLLEQEDFLPTAPAPELDAPARVPLALRGADVDHAITPGEMPTPIDAELDAAKGADIDAFNARAEETALRQIVAGITRTQAPQAVSQLGTNEQQLLQQRRQSKLDSIRQLEAEDNIARADAYGRSVDANALAAKDRDRRADQTLGLRREELDQRSTAEKARATLQQAELERRKAADAVKARKGVGTGKPSVADRRQQMREDALKPRAGWVKIVEADPAFRDPTQAKAFDDANAAFDALQNHRRHAAEAMKLFREAKTLKEKEAALSVVNQQMANIASKLRVAEGLNSSDASNHAVDTMLGLVDGTVANFKNFANEGRLDAILDSAIESAGTNLDTLAKSNNLKRGPAGGGGPVIMKFPDGSEHEVEPGDVELAKKKGGVPRGG